MYTYDKQLMVLLDEEQQAVVGRLVLAQLLGVRQAGGGRLVAARHRAAGRPLRRDRAGRRGSGVVVVAVRRRVAQVEQRRREAHGQVAGRHLVHVAPGRGARQEVQQGEQRFAVFVGQQHHGAVDRFLLQVHGNVCAKTIKLLSNWLPN